VRHLAKQTGISTSTAWKICHEALSLFPYKMQLSQSLLEDGIVWRYAFAREYGALAKGNLCALNAAWFSDEAHVHLDGYTARSNATLSDPSYTMPCCYSDHSCQLQKTNSPSVLNDLWKFHRTAFSSKEVIHILECQVIKSTL
jgi:hypothetical protein